MNEGCGRERGKIEKEETEGRRGRKIEIGARGRGWSGSSSTSKEKRLRW